MDARSADDQAVDQPGAGIVPVARAPDGTIEAPAHQSDPFLLPVQWQPELTAAEDPVAGPAVINQGPRRTLIEPPTGKLRRFYRIDVHRD